MSNAFSDSFIGDRMSKMDSDVVSNLLREKTLKVGFGELFGLHLQAGYLLYAGLTHQQIFQYNENDIYACVADIGWITGHTYVVYGPLMNGATTVLFGSTPTYPDAGRYWEMCERLKINQFYTSPTAIRLLYGQGDEFVNKYDLSKLKVLGTVAETIAAIMPTRITNPLLLLFQ